MAHFFAKLGEGGGEKEREKNLPVSSLELRRERVVSLKTNFFLFFAEFSIDGDEVRRINYNPNLLLVKNSNRLSGQDKLEICEVSFNACSYRLFLQRNISTHYKRYKSGGKCQGLSEFYRFCPDLKVYTVYIGVFRYLRVDLSLNIFEYLENLSLHVSSYVCPDSVN